MRAGNYSSGAEKPRAVIFNLSDCILAISSLLTLAKENDLCRSITGSSEASRSCCMFKSQWQTLCYHLIKGLRCLANLSFEGWLSLSDKYFLVCGIRQGFWHSDSPGALGNRCHYWQGCLTATAGTAELRGPGNKRLPAPYADKTHNKCVF